MFLYNDYIINFSPMFLKETKKVSESTIIIGFR